MIDHLQTTLYGRYLLQTGQHGVTIFFVLSGFLITSSLLQTPHNLKRFYIRRFFRLMPVAWAYLATMWLVVTLTHLHDLTRREILSCVFFYRNYLGSGGFTAGHFWSLSMEEQFYLVWPCLLALAGPRRARWVAGLGAVACALYRFAHWTHYDCIWLSFQTQVRIDAILIGCLLALLFTDPPLRIVAARWARFLTLPALAVLMICIVRFAWLPPLYECLAIAILMGASVLHPLSILARVLSVSTLTWLGAVSYSVYVWQQFFFLHRGNTLALTLSLMCIMPVFALGSYYCIERPCTRFGRTLS